MSDRPPTTSGPSGLSRLARQRDVLLAVGLLMVVVPLPTMVLDLLLVLNLALAVMILVAALFAREPLDFSVFPSILLMVTLFRLALNVSSTRLILLHGDAGWVIDSFGGFVIGGNLIVGLIIFLVLLAIQFLVITSGAGRVAEVAARFTLDAMPGKQMSIDADLNAGVISEVEARQRRTRISEEADFYGAMDGASKFVRGDAIAALLIVAINIVGGVGIGVVQNGSGIGEALNQFTLLTVGDGLVSQIPALLISTAAGVVITRSAGGGDLSGQIGRQLFGNPRGLMVAGSLLLAMGLTPGLPTAPFFLVGGGIAGLGYYNQQRAGREAVTVATAARAPASQPSGPESMVSLIQPEAMEVEIGYGLIPLVEDSAGDNLLNRITIIRRQMAMELGLVLPTIRIRDNLQLPLNTYVIKLRGIEVGRGELMMQHHLAMNPGTAEGEIGGTPAVEPAFRLPAQWIEREAKERAELLGYTVVVPASVVATHLTEVIRRHAPTILSRQDVQRLLTSIREDSPTVVDELVPNLLTVGEIQRVLQNLLADRIPIRDLVSILESLANHAGATRDPDVLSDYARQALSRQITAQYRAEDGKLHVITLSPELEQHLAAGLDAESGRLAVEPAQARALLSECAAQMERLAQYGHPPLLLCSSRLRRPLRQFTERSLPNLAVLAYSEVTPDAEIDAASVVEVSLS